MGEQTVGEQTRDAAGVQFPKRPDGSRSSTAFAKEVVADALGVVDPDADGIRRQRKWRSTYLGPFRELVVHGVHDGDAARGIAAAGLASVHRRMVGVTDAGETPLEDYLANAEPGVRLETATVRGTAEPVREFALPYRGRELRGTELRDHLDRWVEDGIVEPSCRDALVAVADNPEWLDLSDRPLIALGVGSEMGPANTIMRWGGTVIGVDLRRERVWDRVRDRARDSAGTLIHPTRDNGATEAAGADLLEELPAVAAWLRELGTPAVLGNYMYADGGTHVRLSAAADALSTDLIGAGAVDGLAFLATPTDVFVAPEEVVAKAQEAYERGPGNGLVAKAGRLISRGTLFSRNFPAGDTGPGVHDALVPQQGPNYTLAKRIQRWRAVTAAAQGTQVSLNIAPSSRTYSVTKNRALEAAFNGAHHFGVEVFAPDTSTVMMAGMLVHDLRNPRPAADPPWRDEVRGASTGGMWGQSYLPRSVLTLAAVAGAPGLLRR